MKSGWVVSVLLMYAAAASGEGVELKIDSEHAVLSWSSGLDSRYTLRIVDSLVSNDWETVTERLIGTGMTLSVTNPLSGTSGFWKLLEDEGPLTAFMWNLWTESPVDPVRIREIGANTIWLHGNEAWFPEHAAMLETNGIACMPNYKVLNNTDWPNSYPEYRPRFFLSSMPQAATGAVLSLDLLEGYESNYQIEEDSSYLPYWKVWDRTAQAVVSSSDWSYSGGMLTLSAAQTGHEYNAAFSVIDLMASISLDLFSTNAQELVLEQYQELMDTDVSSLFRPTQFAFYFYHHDTPTGTFHDWYGPGTVLSRYFIERYEQKYGKPFDLDTMYRNGDLRSSNDEYHEGYHEVLAVQREAAQDFVMRFTDGFHQRGREVRMFWGDSWIGLEPQESDFPMMGFDQIVTAISTSQGVRRMMTVDESVRRNMRFGFWGVPVGEGVSLLTDLWGRFLRGALRAFPEGMNLGGPDVLNLMENEAGFQAVVQNCYADFKFLYDEIHGAEAYTNGLVVAVLNSWGSCRSWPKEWTANKSQRFWEALTDLPVEVRTLSFAEVEAGGIPAEVDVVLNIGEPGSAWAGGNEWTPVAVAAVEAFVSGGGGFIGVDGCGVTSGNYPLENLLGITFEQLGSPSAEAGVFNNKDKFRRYLAADPAPLSKSMTLSASTASLLGTEAEVGSFFFNAEMDILITPEPDRMDVNGSSGALLTRRQFGSGQAWYASGIPSTETGWDFLKRLIYEVSGQSELRTLLDCETVGGFAYWYPDRQVLLAYNDSVASSNLTLHLGALTNSGPVFCSALTTNAPDFFLSDREISIAVPPLEFSAWRVAPVSSVAMTEQFNYADGTLIENIAGWSNKDGEAGEASVSGGRLELLGNADLIYALGSSFSVHPDENGADNKVPELWLRTRIRFSGGANIRPGLGSSGYTGSFSRYASVHWQMNSASNAPTVFRPNVQNLNGTDVSGGLVYDGSDFAEVLMRLSDAEGALKAEYWFNPPDITNPGESDVERISDYLGSRVIDRFELGCWSMGGSTVLIDRICIGTSLEDLCDWTYGK